MSFPLKLLLSFFGIVLTTIVGAAIYLTVIFDPNDYRDEIAAAVEDQTGRQLSLKGDIDLNIFPWVGVNISQVSLANAKGFGPAPMLEVGALEARMEIMPLIFERAVRIGEIRLENLTVRIAQKGDTNNWDDIAEHQAAKSQEESAAADAPETTEDDITVEVSTDEGQPVDLAVAGITLKNIRIESLMDGDLTVVQLDTLRTGPIRLGEISDLQIEMSAELPDDRSLKLALDTKWSVQPEPLLAALDDLRLDATIAGTGIPGGKQRITATGGATYDGAAQKALVPGLTVTAGDLEATLKSTMDLAGPKGPQGTIEVRTNEFVAQKLAGELGVPLGDPSTAGSTQLDIALAITPDSLRTTRLDAKLDGAKLGGNLAVENFSAPRIRGKLDLAAFTLENWTPPAGEAESADAPAEGGQPATETTLPLEMVKDLDLDLTARIGEFQGSGIKARDVVWTAWSRPGQPFKQELTMKAYGGQIRATNDIDARGKQPKTGLKLNLEAVGLGDLLKGTVGEAYVTGLTQMSLNLDTQGNTIKNMLKAAVGEASYSLKDGSVAGFSLLDVINGAAAKIDGSNTKASGDSSPTRFSELAGKFLFSGGKASAQSLKADSELVSLGGTGGINMDTLSWDLNLLPRLKDTPKIREQRVLSKLIGVDLPLRVKGPLMAPSLSLDLEDALKARAKQEIDAKKDELKAKADAKVEAEKDKLKEKANEEIGRQLDKLFGRKNPTPTPVPSPAASPTPAPAP